MIYFSPHRTPFLFDIDLFDLGYCNGMRGITIEDAKKHNSFISESLVNGHLKAIEDEQYQLKNTDRYYD